VLFQSLPLLVTVSLVVCLFSLYLLKSMRSTEATSGWGSSDLDDLNKHNKSNSWLGPQIKTRQQSWNRQWQQTRWNKWALAVCVRRLCLLSKCKCCELKIKLTKLSWVQDQIKQSKS